MHACCYTVNELHLDKFYVRMRVESRESRDGRVFFCVFRFLCVLNFQLLCWMAMATGNERYRRENAHEHTTGFGDNDYDDI